MNLKSLSAIAFALFTATVSYAQNRDVPIYNADQEMSAVNGMPAGWAIWGPQETKQVSNYTRETANPHSGTACLRINHAANTTNYLVTAPQDAIRPVKGMRLTVSFWARADIPGPATFGFTAYQSISPFVDAPGPGMFKLQVGTNWKRYSFTIREGYEFYADTSKYLLLTFDAGRDHNEQWSFCVDDITAEQQPQNEPFPLLNPATIAHQPLQHRLTPGDSIDITVDTRKHERKTTRTVGGVSFHRVVGFTGQPYNAKGDYTLDPRVETAMREMRLPVTRIYSVGDEPFSVEASLDRVAQLCVRIGVDQRTTVIELEQEIANRALTPEVWARAVRYSRAKGYKFRYWEISNEPYSSMWTVSWTKTGQAFPTAQSYIDHVKAVSKAIRKEMPDAQIGVGIATGYNAWGNQVLRDTAGCYDFFVPHLYSGASVYTESFEDLTLTANYQILDLALQYNALAKAYNKHRSVYIFDTEWGMISGGTKGEDADYVARNAGVMGLVHRAVRLIYYAREGMLRGASGWQMLSNTNGPGFGILSQQAPDQQYMMYWLYYYFNRNLGEWVLPISGVAPYQSGKTKMQAQQPNLAAGPLTPVLATGSADGNTVYLMIANGSWDRAAPLRARLSGMTAGKAQATVLSLPDIDSPPLLARKQDGVAPLSAQFANGVITATVPPHSVVFIVVNRR